MNNKPPFDPVKASFYLIAGILGVQCFVVVVGIFACLIRFVEQDGFTCDPKNRLSELLAAALAAALAFAGGFTRRDQPPPPPSPPPKEPEDHG
jgi:hypothetical protein